MSGLELSSFVHLGWKKESGQRPAFYVYKYFLKLFLPDYNKFFGDRTIISI
jgi:hypothetical protein